MPGTTAVCLCEQNEVRRKLNCVRHIALSWLFDEPFNAFDMG